MIVFYLSLIVVVVAIAVVFAGMFGEQIFDKVHHVLNIFKNYDSEEEK